MRPRSVREYAEALRERYRRAGKGEKGRLLDEFCEVTGYHRKSAVRLLGRRTGEGAAPRRGRPRQCGPAVVAVLGQVWEASDRMGAKRLAAFLPEFVGSLERHGALQVEPAVREQLLGLSAATIDRLLRPLRPRGLRRPWTSTRAAAAIQRQVPVRTFGEWAEVRAGSLQADLVAHCGETTAGVYVNTLLGIDVATGWTECEAVWGKTQQRVGTAVHHVRQRLPFPLRELHTDNGSEFLNHTLYPWCQREGIRFTRGRPYRKNDQAYAEQRNGWVVRRLVGYQRFASQAALQQLQAVYAAVRLWVNFFQPMSKLQSKERVGAKVRKRYDAPRTPYKRLLAAGVLSDDQRQALDREYQRLNPLQVRAELERALQRLWRLAEPSRPLALAREDGEPQPTHTDRTSSSPGAAVAHTEAASSVTDL